MVVSERRFEMVRRHCFRHCGSVVIDPIDFGFSNQSKMGHFRFGVFFGRRSFSG